MLSGTRIGLRPVEPEDLRLFVAWRNARENWSQFFNKFPLSLAGQSTWFNSLLVSQTKKLFTIETISEQLPIGTIGLDNIDFANQSAEYGNVLIGEKDYCGKGLAQEASEILLNFAFDHLNMNRIYLYVLAENLAAIKLYERLGFCPEGIQRQAYFSCGSFRDVLMMAMLREEHRKGKIYANTDCR